MADDTALRDKVSLGCVLRHRQTGDIAVIGHRKDDDSGWWVANGGGLADFVIEKDWTFEARSLEGFVDALDKAIALLRETLQNTADEGWHYGECPKSRRASGQCSCGWSAARTRAERVLKETLDA